MQVLIGSYFILVALLLVAKVLWDVRAGRPILATRNFFLGGLLIFQVTSAATSLITDLYGDIQPPNPVRAGVLFAGAVTSFIAVFFVVYHARWSSLGLEKKLDAYYPIPGSSSLIALSFVLLLISAFTRFVLTVVPVFNILAIQLAPAFAAAACAAACWAWGRNIKNPVLLLSASTIALLAFFLVIYQNFGRRDATSVLLAGVWGAFHGGLKFIDWRRAVLPLTVLGVFALVVIAALTATRSEKVINMGLGEVVQRLFSANIVYGLLDIFSGQQCGPISMYIVETRPSEIQYDTLHSVKYLFTMPVPRVLWEQYISIPKPIALGLSLVPEVGILHKSPGYNVGPGIIGHIWNDNPFLAFPLYAVSITCLVSSLDRRVARQPDNPFVVIPAGVVLGEIVALARGELGLFFFRTVMAIVTVHFTMKILAKIFAATGAPLRAEDGSLLLPRGAAPQDALIDPEVEAQYIEDSTENQRHA